MVSLSQILTPKKDNFFVMLHFTCTCIRFFTKSIQIIQKNIVFEKGHPRNIPVSYFKIQPAVSEKKIF